MRTVLGTMAILMTLAMPATLPARPIVLAYGDSTTHGGVEDPLGSWPAQLQALRPDLTIVNAGAGGDTTDNFDRYYKVLDAYAPDHVILMMGTNDPVCTTAIAPACDSEHATPERTARHLRRMAGIARRRGAEVWVMTQTPAVFVLAEYCAKNPTVGGCPDAEAIAASFARRQRYTRDVAHQLLAWRAVPRVHVVDLRDEFTARSWTAHTTDGLHPNRAGNTLIANFVAAQLP